MNHLSDFSAQLKKLERREQVTELVGGCVAFGLSLALLLTIIFRG